MFRKNNNILPIKKRRQKRRREREEKKVPLHVDVGHLLSHFHITEKYSIFVIPSKCSSIRAGLDSLDSYTQYKSISSSKIRTYESREEATKIGQRETIIEIKYRRELRDSRDATIAIRHVPFRVSFRRGRNVLTTQ